MLQKLNCFDVTIRSRKDLEHGRYFKVGALDLESACKIASAQLIGRHEYIYSIAETPSCLYIEVPA